MASQTKIKLIFPVLLITLVSFFSVFSSQADEDVSESAPLYLYYFETNDVMLDDGATEYYRFATLPNEEVTLVAYGLDGLVIPELKLYTTDGTILGYGAAANPDHPYVQIITFSSRALELLRFDVTAHNTGTDNGLIRVMLFEGDPIAGDLTYLDTVNPLLPGRAFMVSGHNEQHPTLDEVGLQTRLQVLPVERFRQRPDVFSSRGSEEDPPEIPDRFDPADYDEWWNTGDEAIYFFTVSPIPEKLTAITVNEVDKYDTFNLLTFFYFDYFFIVGEGSDPIIFQRSQPCSDVSLDTRAECIEETGTFGRETGEVFDDNTTEIFEGDEVVIITIDTVAPTRDSIRACVEGTPPDGFGIYETAPPPDPLDPNSYFLDGSNCDDQLTGSPTILEGETGNSIFGYGGNDTIYGSNGADIIVGGNGNDALYGGIGDDSLFGEDGSDRFVGGAGVDNIVGGTGSDWVDYSHTYDPYTDTYTETTVGIEVRLPDETGAFSTTGPAQNPAQEDNLNSVENLIGSSGSDTITGGTNNNIIWGGLGSDTIDGGNGDDTIYAFAPGDITFGATTISGAAGAGDTDTIYGGAGNDILIVGAGINLIYGEEGSDIAILQGSYNDATVIDFVTNDDDSPDMVGVAATANGDALVMVSNGDIINFAPFPNSITADMDAGTITDGATVTLAIDHDDLNTSNACATTGTIASCDVYYGGTVPTIQVIGTAQGDTFITSMWMSETINAQGGDDIVYGSMGNDTLGGGSGIDLLTYIDVFTNTTVFNTGSATNYSQTGVTINLATSTVVINIPNSTEPNATFTQTVNGFENVEGSPNDDNITGDGNANTIFVTNGTDSVDGGAGTDTLDFINLNASGVGVTVNLDSSVTPDGYSALAYEFTTGSGTIANIENVNATNQTDFIQGNSGNNIINAYNGNDLIYGTLGTDTVNGGGGVDQLTYTNHNTTVSFNVTACASACGTATTSGSTTTFTEVEALAGGTTTDIFVISGNYTSYSTGDFETAIQLSGGSGTDIFSFLGGTAGYFILDSEDYGNPNVLYNGFTVAYIPTGICQGATCYQQVLDMSSGFPIVTNTYIAFTTLCLIPGTPRTLNGDATDNTFDEVDLQSACNEFIYAGGHTTGDTADYSNVILDAASAFIYNISTDVAQIVVTGDANIGVDTITNVETIIGSDGNHQDFFVFNNTTPATVNLTIDAGDSLAGASTDLTLGDMLDFSNITLSSGISVNLGTATAQDIFGAAGNFQLTIATGSEITQVVGSQGADTITGDGSANLLDGFDGADTVNGGNGNDIIIGTNDNDNDTYNGQGNTDTVTYASVTGYAYDNPVTANQTVTVNAATVTVNFNGATDTVSNVETLILGTGNDNITFNTANSALTTIDGNVGTDTYTSNFAGVSYLCSTGVDTTFEFSTTNTNCDNPLTLDNVENVTFNNNSNDTFVFTYTADAENSIANTFDAGGGNGDTADYSGSSVDLYVTPIDDNTTEVLIGAVTDTLENFENIEAGSGTDTIDYSNITGPLTITQTGSTTHTVTNGSTIDDDLTNFENIIATNQADAIVVNTAPAGHSYDGNGGADTVTYTTPVTVNTVSGAVDFEVTNGGGTDSITNIETIETDSGDDIFNIDLDTLASENSGVTFTFNGGGGTNTFNFTSAGAAGLSAPVSIIIQGSAGSTTNLNFSNVSNSGGVNLDLSDTGQQTVFTNFTVTLDVDTVNATGTANGDTITGNNDANMIDGGGGDDIPSGGGGDDIIDGGTGNDTIDGGAGDDTLVGGENVDCSVDTCIAGNDGNDVINGGDGDDTIVGGNNVQCSTGDNPTVGTDGSDTIYGGNGDTTGDTIDGDHNVTCGGGTVGAGAADTIYGGHNNADGTIEGDETVGADTINGGDGNDTIYGGNNNTGIGTDATGDSSGADTINGDAGTDTIYGGNNNTNVTGDDIGNDTGDDVINGGDAADTVYGGNNNTNMNATDSGNDTGDDTLDGDDGDDTIYGGNDNTNMNSTNSGNDTGTDTIDGGNDDDTMYGGNDNSTIAGGDPGNDSGDTITDNATGDADTVYGDNNGPGGDGDDDIDVNEPGMGNGDDTGHVDNSDGSGTTGDDTVDQDTGDTVDTNP